MFFRLYPLNKRGDVNAITSDGETPLDYFNSQVVNRHFNPLVDEEMGDEEDEEMGEEELVQEIARRVAARLIREKKQDAMANKLAERIFRRLASK